MAGWNEGGGFEAEVSETPPVTETPVPEAKLDAPSAEPLPEAPPQPVIEAESNETPTFSESPQPEELSSSEIDVAAVEPPPLEANEGQLRADITSAEAATSEPTDLAPPDIFEVAAPHTDLPTEPEALAPSDTRLTDAELADMAGMDHEKFAEILAQEPGIRESPDTYLSPDYVDQHLAQFESAHRLQSHVMQNGIGNEKDGYAFVTPNEVAESDLALRPDDGRVQITMNRLNGPLRDMVEIPSGNEQSANNPDWAPGGHDRETGASEGVMQASDWPVNRLIRGPLRDIE